ncbi:cilia and flagella associated protein 20 [Phyllostomus discolor]|uniref:Cilia and flagella associated protein 20 n=1 Tax=Phyllostomus discolor TaxID=89673 RepID=A0A834DBN4_9CHIR|nr:cilia and flagella associated protein 20 [Phyllostomus discolor]
MTPTCAHVTGAGRQERAPAVPGEQLPEHHSGQALHLHHAHAAGRRLEPDSVQPVGLHSPGLRHQLHRDPESIHANCRIRRVYFSDRLYSEDELPAEFKLYLPVQNKAKQ